MPTRPRYELDNACVIKGWNDADLAARLDPQVNAETVRRWRTGEQTPYKYHITQMCVLFEVKHPKELNLDAQFNASTRCGEDEIIAMLKDYDRREVLAILAQLPAFAGVDLTALFSTTVIAPEKLLSVCRAVIKGCWNLLDQNGMYIADYFLSACIPQLESLAEHLSPHQHQAASLVVEAKIIQMNIVGYKLKFSQRETFGLDAVRFGGISGDRNLHAMALGWHGRTYTFCYDQPGKAIAIFNDALPLLNENALLGQADIYIGLALAYAMDTTQDDYETKAREYVAQAHMAMPDHPELDPLYHCIRTGQSEIDRIEGDVYFILAKHFPTQKEYAQMAYDAYMKSTSKQSLSKEYRSRALIHKAEAACCIDDMGQYLDCLEEGVRIALQIGIDHQISQAVTVLQKAPRKWRNEQRYIELGKILKPTIVIARK
jgi:hypothetical protein